MNIFVVIQMNLFIFAKKQVFDVKIALNIIFLKKFIPKDKKKIQIIVPKGSIISLGLSS
jgi:hypothetical protein